MSLLFCLFFPRVTAWMGFVGRHRCVYIWRDGRNTLRSDFGTATILSGGHLARQHGGDILVRRRHGLG